MLTSTAYRQALAGGPRHGVGGADGWDPYNRVAVVAVGYRARDVPHPLDGFGYLSPQRRPARRAGRAVVFIYFRRAWPPGAVLLRAMCGG